MAAWILRLYVFKTHFYRKVVIFDSICTGLKVSVSEIMGRVLLLAVSLWVLCFSVAEANHCRNIHRPISCCADTKVVRKDGEWVMECKTCDSGYKPSSSKEQCLPEKDCKKGYGPGPMRVYEDRCIKCSDKNCKHCTHVFYDCTECKNNYLLDPQGACQRKLF